MNGDILSLPLQGHFNSGTLGKACRIAGRLAIIPVVLPNETLRAAKIFPATWPNLLEDVAMTSRSGLMLIFLLGLANGGAAYAQRISDDEFNAYPMALASTALEEPAPMPESPKGFSRYPEPGVASAAIDGPWQTPPGNNAAPSMMACAAGTCDLPCRPCCRGGWVGGAGVYVIKPHWTTNPAYATNIISPAGVSLDSQTDFAYSYAATPLIWFGYVGQNGLGIRTRFWFYDQSETMTLANDGSLTVISAAPLNYLNSSSTDGDQLTFTSGLEVDVVDIEATQTFDLGWLTGQLSAGGRYARIEQTYHHVETPLTALDDIIDSSHTFDGFGPSLGAEVRRNLMDSGLSLYANGRGTLLFGKSSQQALSINNNVLTNYGSYTNWDLVPTLESELGVLWQYNTDRGRMFLDAGVFAIAFFGAGNSANNQILLNSTDDQADKNSTLGFFGFKAAAGVTY